MRKTGGRMSVARRIPTPGEWRRVGGMTLFIVSLNAAGVINRAGFIIADLFVVVWAMAIAYWRFAHLDRRLAPSQISSTPPVLRSAGVSPPVSPPMPQPVAVLPPQHRPVRVPSPMPQPIAISPPQLRPAFS